mmetsp:Transcript_11727/g.31583  ORF Transcript_11727/g.31583 Transcript_11727/m.31583 type:complete len:112 (-) Transcript_11727:663-998(-)
MKGGLNSAVCSCDTRQVLYATSARCGNSGGRPLRFHVAKIIAKAAESHTASGSITKPAVGFVIYMAAATATAVSQTGTATVSEKPTFRSTFVTWFQTSPTQTCRAYATSAG